MAYWSLTVGFVAAAVGAIWSAVAGRGHAPLLGLALVLGVCWFVNVGRGDRRHAGRKH